MSLSLGQAAKLAGVGKTTISRAIASGRLSASRRDDGGYSIDPAELSRVYDVRPDRLDKPVTPSTVSQDGSEERGATPDAAEETRRALEVVVLEQQILALRQIVDSERERREAAEIDRDRWADQAARIAALLPPPPSNDTGKKPGFIDRILGRKSA